MKLSELARALSAEVIGDAAVDIQRVVHPLDAAASTDLAVALSKEALSAADGRPAGALLVAPATPRPDDQRTLLVYAGHERQAIATLTALFDRGPQHDPGIHPTAVVAADAVIGDGVSIGPHAVIGSRDRIGERTTVLANVTIGADVDIGADCVIHPGVAIGDRITIGARVRIHANAVLGSDGFGFIPAGSAGDAPQRIHALGTVVIGDDVEIGAGTTIDRATLRQTRIGDRTKIDNQVQIGHNVIVGEACLICGLVGIAGSTIIGDRVRIGAAAGISDHITIGADAAVGAMSGVGTDVPAGVTVWGNPADRYEKTRQRLVSIARLKGLFARVEALERRGGGSPKGRR